MSRQTAAASYWCDMDEIACVVAGVVALLAGTYLLVCWLDRYTRDVRDAISGGDDD